MDILKRGFGFLLEVCLFVRESACIRRTLGREGKAEKNVSGTSKICQTFGKFQFGHCLGVIGNGVVRWARATAIVRFNAILCFGASGQRFMKLMVTPDAKSWLHYLGMAELKGPKHQNDATHASGEHMFFWWFVSDARHAFPRMVLPVHAGTFKMWIV